MFVFFLLPFNENIVPGENRMFIPEVTHIRPGYSILYVCPSLWNMWQINGIIHGSRIILTNLAYKYG